MGKISGYIDKRLVFRETFNNEQSVRANGGVPSFTTFDRGKATINSANSSVKYPKLSRGIYSFRIKAKFANYNTVYYLFDCRTSSGVGVGYTIIWNSTGVIAADSGVTYINGSNANSSLPLNTEGEIVLKGVTINNTATVFNMFSRFDLGYSPINAEFYLFEIYKGTLSDQDIKNLYEGKYNKKCAIDNKEESLGPECLRDGNNINDSTWGRNATAWNLIPGGSARYNKAENARAITQANVNMAVSLKSGTNYKMSFTISDCIGVAWMAITDTTATVIYYTNPSSNTLARFSNGDHSIVINTGTANAGGLSLYGYTGGEAFTISNISIKELYQGEPKSLLVTDSAKGTIYNKTSYNLLSVNNNPEFVTTDEWVLGTGWSIDTNKQVAVFQGTGASSNIFISTATVGNLYRWVYKINSISNGYVQKVGGNTIIQRSSPGIYIEEDIATGSSLGLRGIGVTEAEIEYCYLYEYVPVVINTNVPIKKQAETFASFFTTIATSKLDFGRPDSLNGNKTFVFWAKTSSWNSVLDSRFVDNGRTMIRGISASSQYRISSDGGSTYGSANNNSLKVNTWQCVAIVRNANGISPVYINGVLDSSINLNSGPVAIGTTSLTLGNRSTNDRQFHGFIDNFRVIDGILTQEEIAQIFSSERRKYNV